MDYQLTETQHAIKKLAETLAMEQLAPRAEEVDRRVLFPRENLHKLTEAGFMGMLVPQKHGGRGVDSLSFVLSVEALAKACAATALVVVAHNLAAFTLATWGTEKQRSQYLPPLIEGKKLAILAHTEPNAGANTAAIESRTSFKNGAYMLQGQKNFITAAQEAELFLLYAKTKGKEGQEGISIFLVEKDTPGFQIGGRNPMLGFKGAGEGELYYEDCIVPQENLLGKEGEGLKIMGSYVGLAMLGAGALSLGLAGAALETSIKYAKERIISNQPLSSHQAIQFHLADMITCREAARSLLYQAACFREINPTGANGECFKAKLFASEAAIKITQLALQLHGGHGYCEELPLQRYLRDAYGLTVHFSTSELLRSNIAKITLGS